MNNFISVLIIEDDVQACEELTQCIAQYEDNQYRNKIIHSSTLHFYKKYKPFQ